MRFTIRELMLLTVIVAMAVGWWVDATARDRMWRAFLIRAMQEEARLERFTITTPSGEVLNIVPNVEARADDVPTK